MLHRLAFAWLLQLLAGRRSTGACAEALPRQLLGNAPKYTRVDGDVETVWQRPAGDETPKGLFFIAHGCNHQGTDLFASGGADGLPEETCKQSNLGKCLGLPEEIRLRHAALARGYIVMAISGGSGKKSCWHPGDELKVKKAVQHVLGEEGMPIETQVLASGASSGGSFMGALAQRVEAGGLPNLKCIVPEIMDIDDTLNRGIPTLFVHMPKDMRTATAVAESLVNLRERGIRSAEIQVQPVPITTDLLSACLASDLASAVVQSLQAHNVLDGGGFLKANSRRYLWQQPVVAAIEGKEDMVIPDEGCISELMHVAFAQHEFTSQYAEEMLDFCEEKGSYSSLAQTAASASASSLQGRAMDPDEALQAALPSSSSKGVLVFASLGFVIITVAILIRSSGRGAFAKGRADRHALTGQKEGDK